MGTVAVLFPDFEEPTNTRQNLLDLREKLRKKQKKKPNPQNEQQRRLSEFWQEQWAKNHSSELNPHPKYRFSQPDILCLKRLMEDTPDEMVAVFMVEFLDYKDGRYSKIDWLTTRSLKTMCTNAVIAELNADPDVQNAKPHIVRSMFPHVFSEGIPHGIDER
jgi:hypothetical protein